MIKIPLNVRYYVQAVNNLKNEIQLVKLLNSYPLKIDIQPLHCTMCRYQQKFSESQGGRKEGHRIQYLPSPSSDSLDNHARTRVSDVTRGNNDTWSPPWGRGLRWWWVAKVWCAGTVQWTLHMCSVLCRIDSRGQFVGDCRRDNMWTSKTQAHLLKNESNLKTIGNIFIYCLWIFMF